MEEREEQVSEGGNHITGFLLRMKGGKWLDNCHILYNADAIGVRRMVFGNEAQVSLVSFPLDIR